MATTFIRILLLLLIIGLLFCAACSASVESPTPFSTATLSGISSTSQSITTTFSSITTSILTTSSTIIPTQTSLSTSTTSTSNSGPILVSITITPSGSIALQPDKGKYLKAIGTYSNSSTKDITSEVTWTSDSPVATVDSKGFVTIINTTEKAHITASLDGLISSSITVSYVPFC